jgi:hypothetical protein
MSKTPLHTVPRHSKQRRATIAGMSTVLRVRLTGEDAELGHVAAGDVARMLLGVERAVARAAGHVIGRQVKPTGRRGRTIEETTRFRLLGIERGSVVGVLELPEEVADNGALDLDTPSLGDLALESALATAAEAHSVVLRRIVHGEQLTIGLDAGAFWESRTIQELAADQHIEPIADVETLRDASASADEIDRMLAALGTM